MWNLRLFTLVFPIVIVILLLMSLSGCAVTNPAHTSVRATGTGSDIDSAIASAQRHAIEEAVGSIVLSERATSGFALVKDDVLSHSAGYIDKTKLVSVTRNGDQYIATVDVVVASSKIAERMIATGTSSAFAGRQHETQLTTLLSERDSGDRLLSKILDSYPEKAFKVVQRPYIMSLGEDRRIRISIPLELSWEHTYLAALDEVLSRLEDGDPGFFKQARGNVRLYGRGLNNQYYFNDRIRVNMIRDAITSKSLRVRIQFITDSGPIYDSCWTPDAHAGFKPAFYGIGTSAPSLDLFGYTVEKNSIELAFPQSDISYLSQVKRIDLSIVASQHCRY